MQFLSTEKGLQLFANLLILYAAYYLTKKDYLPRKAVPLLIAAYSGLPGNPFAMFSTAQPSLPVRSQDLPRPQSDEVSWVTPLAMGLYIYHAF